jgi:DNA-binding MarR family transcriptional regulator
VTVVALPAESKSDQLHRATYIFLNLGSAALSVDIEDICAAEGLTEAHFRVLWVLCREADSQGLPMGDLADGLINRAADLTRLVDKLEKLGYVSRVRAEEDKRRIIAKMTSSGRRVFERLARQVQQIHNEQFASLTQTEQKQLVALMKKVLVARVPKEQHTSWLMGGKK